MPTPNDTPATPATPTSREPNAGVTFDPLRIKTGFDYLKKGSDHKTYGIDVEAWGNQVEVHGNPDLRDKIVTFLSTTPPSAPEPAAAGQVEGDAAFVKRMSKTVEKRLKFANGDERKGLVDKARLLVLARRGASLPASSAPQAIVDRSVSLPGGEPHYLTQETHDGLYEQLREHLAFFNGLMVRLSFPDELPSTEAFADWIVAHHVPQVDAREGAEPVRWEWRADYQSYPAIAGVGWQNGKSKERAEELARIYNGEVRPLYASSPPRPDPAKDGGRPPRDPTLAMLQAGYDVLSKIYPPKANGGNAIGQHIVWDAMYAAFVIAPPEPVSPKATELTCLGKECVFDVSSDKPCSHCGWHPYIVPANATPTDRDAAGGASEDEERAYSLVDSIRSRDGGAFELMRDEAAGAITLALAAARFSSLDPASGHHSARDALRQIAALRHSLPRYTIVTQDNAVEAVGRLNRHIIGIFDLADAALAAGHQDRTAPAVGEAHRFKAGDLVSVPECVCSSKDSVSPVDAVVVSVETEGRYVVRARGEELWVTGGEVTARATPPTSTGTEASR